MNVRGDFGAPYSCTGDWYRRYVEGQAELVGEGRREFHIVDGLVLMSASVEK